MEAQLRIAAYLADQNQGDGRSLGISRMSLLVLEALARRGEVSMEVLASKTSEQGPRNRASIEVWPWGTRSRVMRVLTDNLHPLLPSRMPRPDLYYYPKGFLPRFGGGRTPTVVTVHDAIIQHYAENYPASRHPLDYSYWTESLKFSLQRASAVFTVSETAKGQIERFMRLHGLGPRDIRVTYEPCAYEATEQPLDPPKGGYALHLCSTEPHKMTAPLVEWWLGSAQQMPLHLVGAISKDIAALIAGRSQVIKFPFLSDAQLEEQIRAANVLVLPSEIEGFGLPGIEAYYLGTPVCHVEETSVAEILEHATRKGRFSLDAWESLQHALDECLAMSSGEIHAVGLALRRRYATEAVVDSMLQGFREVVGSQ
jgi:glycosyltransferase involved in cell wall biosynthesis